MRGVITRIGVGFGVVTSEAGRNYTVARSSFTGRPFELTAGDVVEFQPGGEDGRFALGLQLTPFVRSPNGRLMHRAKVPRRGLGAYDWARARRGAEAQEE